jgi:hypothetical protein
MSTVFFWRGAQLFNRLVLVLVGEGCVFVTPFGNEGGPLGSGSN